MRRSDKGKKRPGISAALKKRWANLPEEKKDSHRKRSRAVWDQLSEEEKERQRSFLVGRNLNPESRKKMAATMKARWARLKAEGQSWWQKGRSDKGKRHVWTLESVARRENTRRKNGVKHPSLSYTEEEKRQHRLKRQAKWNSLSEEQKDAHVKKSLAGMKGISGASDAGRGFWGGLSAEQKTQWRERSIAW